MTESFCAEAALAPLKAFQRRTVDYVFDRLYGTSDPVRQFLVADEVGLGKTMVARGVIARAIELLWDRADRIDVLYICSNQAIASQNLNRLNVLNRRELTLPTRMTLVPLQLRGAGALDSNKVNFVSLTPGTTFDLRSTTGVTPERAFLRHLLSDLVTDPRGLHNLLQVSAGAEGWSRAVEAMSLDGVDTRIVERFQNEVRANSVLFDELERVCGLFHRRRESYPEEITAPRNPLVGQLRKRLSHCCVEALKPDLIILDEFQRFRDLLHGDTEAGELAQELFEYSGADGRATRTLLLSATPYRMLTLAGDNSEEGDHYQDFIETLGFLFGRERGREAAADVARDMRAFRSLLQGLPQTREKAVEARKAIEGQLRRVMVRTERVSSTKDRNSMLVERARTLSVSSEDLVEASAVSKVAEILDAPEIVEYWKSSPYLLNFMRDYDLKKKLVERVRAPGADVRLHDAVRNAGPTLLKRSAIAWYRLLAPANTRMRALMDDVFGQRLEQNLWIPPALPYYGSARPDTPPTKALVFSAWSVAPDAIAAILSYEAERRVGAGDDQRKYFEQHRLRPLQFRRDQERLTGLRTLLLIYPSPILAQLADPLAAFSECDSTPSEAAMRAAIAVRLEPSLARMRPTSAAPTAPTLEWAVPAMLDELTGKRSRGWLEASSGMQDLASEDAFREHVAELASVATRNEYAGSRAELMELLVDVALGSPAVCALRALKRIAPELAWDEPALLSAAAKVAWAFRALFNQRNSVALLRRNSDDFYWRQALTYCAQNNLQAVLDEYAHYLVEAEGLVARAPMERAKGVADAMAKALSIRPSQIEVDHVATKGKTIRIETFQMRGRFAMRLADYRDEDGSVSRLGGVRDAFNSPFKPFVLATTSIGQEGLDFHPYCYRVYHWNLPGNPVDLEQREGRIQRFKSHAVRLNLADRQAGAVRTCGQEVNDPWKLMFDMARAETAADSDLVPYWIYEGRVRVERHVPMLPFSREVTRLSWLKRSLAVYRLTFGQPRQDDLLDYLQNLAGAGMTADTVDDLQIRLEPPGGRSSTSGRF